VHLDGRVLGEHAGVTGDNIRACARAERGGGRAAVRGAVSSRGDPAGRGRAAQALLTRSLTLKGNQLAGGGRALAGGAEGRPGCAVRSTREGRRPRGLALLSRRAGVVFDQPRRAWRRASLRAVRPATGGSRVLGGGFIAGTSGGLRGCGLGASTSRRWGRPGAPCGFVASRVAAAGAGDDRADTPGAGVWTMRDTGPPSAVGVGVLSPQAVERIITDRVAALRGEAVLVAGRAERSV
jgi:hypothetical protein